MTPDRPLTALEWTTRKLREEILSGALPHGESIKQDEVARRLGVSRMPVREAIRTLAAEGFMIERANRKAIVAPLDPDDAVELFEIRAAIECLAAKQSIPALAQGDLDALEEAHERLTGALPQDYPERHLEFHRALYAGAGPRLRALVEQHILQAERYLRFEILSLDVSDEDRSEHAALLSAARSGDCGRAIEILHPHIAEAGREIAAALKHAEEQ